MAEEKKYKIALRSGYTMNENSPNKRDEVTLYGLSKNDMFKISTHIGQDYLIQYNTKNGFIVVNLKFFSTCYVREDNSGKE